MPYQRLCLAGVLLPFTVWAAVFGTVRGVVHDPDHRPVPGAQVVVKSSTSDYSQKLTTDADGSFEATALPVGAYLVTVHQGRIRACRAADRGRLWQRSGAALPARDRDQERASHRIGSRAGREPGTDDAHHHHQPQRNRNDARRRFEQQPDRHHRLRSRSMGDARPASRARRTPGDLGHRRRSHPEYQHRQQHRPADRSRRISTTWKRSAAAIPPRTATAPTASSTSSREPASNATTKRELFTTFGTFHQTNDQMNFGSHTEKFAYFGSVNGNRSDYGLETPGPDVLHDRVWGLGGMGTLIYNRDANNQFRFVTSLRRDDYQIPNDPDAQDGWNPRSWSGSAMRWQVSPGCIRSGPACCSRSRPSTTTIAPTMTATRATLPSAPRSTGLHSTPARRSRSTR